MTAPVPGVVALVAHVRDVPADERTAFAARLRDHVRAGALAIETCHRVEGYVVAPTGDVDRIARAVGLPPGGRVLTDADAVRHAIAVAVGRDSVVVGEDQILHQVRTAVDDARATGALPTALERLFSSALRAGRRARSWRHGTPPSLADVAVAEIEAAAGPLDGRGVLVVGAGRMGRLAVRAAVAAGADVAVANRSPEGAQALAAETGTRVEPFDPGAAAGDVAGIIVAIAGAWPIGPAALEALARGSTVVVDLSVPAAVPADAIERLGTRFVSADALARRLAETSPAQDRAMARMDRLTEETAAEFLDWLDGRQRRTTADVLRQRVERDREAELAALWRRLPDLEPEARDAIVRMTHHLTDGLLREPLERLRRDRDGQDEQAIRDLFAL